MAKNSKNGLEKQNIIIGQFAKTVRQEENRIRRGEMNFIETVIAESTRKRKEWESKKPAAQPYISHYNPNNPLNGFNQKTKDEQKAILKALKAKEKAAKAVQVEIENC